MNLERLKFGAYAGVAGGVVFGLMMGGMGLSMIGQMVGHPSALTGFVVHLVISAFIGTTFATFFHNLIRSTRSGMAYGLMYGGVWWFLGPLTLMPLLMGMGLHWSASAISTMLPSLLGHLIYGVLLGTSYLWLKSPEGSRGQTSLAELCMYNTPSSSVDPEREERSR